MTLSRRKFLGFAGAAAASAAAGGAAWEGLLRDHVEGRSPAASGSTAASRLGLAPAQERVLVVVQLTGGNDGLNTLVPIDGRYHDARPTLGLADTSLVRLPGEDHYGLAPELKPLGGLWAGHQLAAVDGIGFEGSSHSHFQAMDWWWSATPAKSTTTGWLGRWLDVTTEGAHGDPNPLRGIAIGQGSPAMRAEHAVATAISDPSLFALRAPAGVDDQGLVKAFTAAAQPLVADRPLEAQAQQAMTDVVDAVHRLAPAGLGQPSTGKGGGAGPGAAAAGGKAKGTVTDGLDLAAKLIGLDLGTRVIVVGAGGYDTHAGEGPTHQALLADLAGGIGGFFDAVKKSGHDKRVMVMTTSEFGRRVAENGSGGTDHGTGGVQFLAGPGVAGKVVGTADLGRLTPEGDVPSAIDARSLYAVGLQWLGGPDTDVLGKAYDTYGLLQV